MLAELTHRCPLMCPYCSNPLELVRKEKELETADWKADWISPDWDEDVTKPQPSPLLRTDFSVSGEIASARAYVTSLGLYEIEINGHIVGDQVFTPGWTSYKSRVQYQTYDVTELLRQGPNATVEGPRCRYVAVGEVEGQRRLVPLVASP